MFQIESSYICQLTFSDIPVDKNFEKQTELASNRTLPRLTKKRNAKRKKREIRVFVSSTFRDFTNEREEIIKKAFREVSALEM